MNRFAALLDRLAYEPSRNAKLRLMTDYFRTTPDPDRGYALAAITGALSFRHAKPGMIRALIAERTDPVLFELSYDYVGDLSETVALMWPAPPPPRRARSGGEVSGERSSFGRAQTPHPPRPRRRQLPRSRSTQAPRPHHVVTTLAALGKSELPAQLAAWLDALDETGRWALLKLVTGALRIGVSARLAKTAVAALGGKEPDEIELLWPALAPPYAELFAWIEGRAEKPVSVDPAPFRPVMLATRSRNRISPRSTRRDFTAEWKWDGIRVQAVGRHEPTASASRGFIRAPARTFPARFPI